MDASAGGDSVDGGSRGAGHHCPAQKAFESAEGGPDESIVKEERSGVAQATEEELAAITRFLKRRAGSAPASAGAGRAAALAWAGLKLAGVVLVAAGVGVGLGDGDELDSGGSCVAHQPGRTCR